MNICCVLNLFDFLKVGYWNKGKNRIKFRILINDWNLIDIIVDFL